MLPQAVLRQGILQQGMLSNGSAHDAAAQPISIDTFLGPAVPWVSSHELIANRPSASRLDGVAQHPVFDTSKRIVDFTVSALLLIALLPLFAAVAAFIRLTSRGPALFHQRRLTVGGREFEMLKFRTMVHDAEKYSGPQFASENDPRVTRIGRFLRATRIDELPQLLNVLRGEMSLIGPRPERPEMAESLEKELPHFTGRLAVKGGITGLAQVTSGYAANLHSYRHKLALDLLYIENRSLRLDLLIAAKTVRVIFSGSGSR